MVSEEHSPESRELLACLRSGTELLDSWPQWPQNIKMAILGKQRHKGKYQVPQW